MVGEIGGSKIVEKRGKDEIAYRAAMVIHRHARQREDLASLFLAVFVEIGNTEQLRNTSANFAGCPGLSERLHLGIGHTARLPVGTRFDHAIVAVVRRAYKAGDSFSIPAHVAVDLSLELER